MSKNEKILIGSFFSLILLIFLLCFGKIDFICVFKKYLGISCPGCGLTRAFTSILTGNILKSFSYNILAFFIFLLGIVFFIMIIYDLIKKDNVFEKTIIFIFSHWSILLILTGISWILNIYRGI